jgi:DNA polymerase V
VKKQYAAIDLKSFYASVECVDRGLNPLDTFLVVADESRTEKTICLAVSPPLKAYGIPGRARLFEVVEGVKKANAKRKNRLKNKNFCGASHFAYYVDRNPEMMIDYIVAPPRMKRYMEMSSQIYNIYLEFVAPEDIHVYSVDEVFIDLTDYLRANKMTAAQMCEKMVRTVFERTGITATAGIGTNMYLAKIAMDIEAKHIKAGMDDVRIAELDEQSYRRNLWNHRPITDFWRIGRGYSEKLAQNGMFTMGDVARCSVYNEDLLYKLFGKNAELLIDHAWGVEPCTIADIKSYRPDNTSISRGQVLSTPYEYDKAFLIIREMAELLALDLVKKGLCTDQIVLTVGYDINNISNKEKFRGKTEIDFYGRVAPKRAHGSQNIGTFTSSSVLVVKAATELFARIVDKKLSVRRMYVVANHTQDEKEYKAKPKQLSLFSEPEQETETEEKAIQNTVLKLQSRFGKNAVIKGMNLFEGATTVERNKTIGGHRE